jgi:hypothetical protein
MKYLVLVLILFSVSFTYAETPLYMQRGGIRYTDTDNQIFYGVHAVKAISDLYMFGLDAEVTWNLHNLMFVGLQGSVSFSSLEPGAEQNLGLFRVGGVVGSEIFRAGAYLSKAPLVNITSVDVYGDTLHIDEELFGFGWSGSISGRVGKEGYIYMKMFMEYLFAGSEYIGWNLGISIGFGSRFY